MNVQELLIEVATAPVVKRGITNHAALNEAYDYGSAFSRGMRIDLNGLTILLISGTASIDEAGRTVHVGDFRAQLRRTFDNITQLLAAEGATWHDIVRTTCYLRDIERDYQAFNEERTKFYKEQGLDPLPASTGIQAILCRPDLLVEIEAIVMFRQTSPSEQEERHALRVCFCDGGCACVHHLGPAICTMLVRPQSARPTGASFPEALYRRARRLAPVFEVHHSLLRALPGSRRVQRRRPRHPRSRPERSLGNPHWLHRPN